MSFINTIIKAFVGDKSQKDVKATQPYITKIKALEPVLAALSHDELRAKTGEFKEKIKALICYRGIDILSAMILTALPEVLRSLPTGGVDLRMIIFPILLILVMILRPQGLMGRKEIFEK